ncbi:MAG: hypothetical protein JWO86_5105 [Myxococcaceae bacterium]|nr:hypothetical protein [Myxococcaceae bacterium]
MRRARAARRAMPLARPRIFARDRRVLTLSGFASFGPDRLSLETPIRDLLMGILGFLRTAPEQLDSRDLPRHATMIRELMDHEVSARWNDGPSRVTEMPIRRLEFAVRDWVCSYKRGTHPLLLSYALNSAELIGAIAFGRHAWSSRDDLEIEPVVETSPDGRSLHFLSDSTFKREITMHQVGGTLVLARIPEDGIVRQVDGHVRHALTEPFDFRAELLVTENENGRRPWRRGERIMRGAYRPIVSAPAQWFTHAVELADDHDRQHRETRYLAVPTWSEAPAGAAPPRH